MYTKPIGDITFSDIQAFVDQKNKESVILDHNPHPRLPLPEGERAGVRGRA